MIVLDTHAWLWMAADLGRLSRPARRAIDAADRIGVCTISCWELGMLVASGRIKLDREVRLWVRQALGIERVEAIQLTSETAVAASLLPNLFPGDPADRVIYATASGLGVPLVTRDDRIGAFDPRRVIW